MALAFEDVARQALSLPPDEKASLIDRLLVTMDAEVLSAWEEAGLDEAERR